MDTKQRTERNWRSATRALWVVVFALFVLTSGDYGMSWDEITRWDSGDLKLEYYKTLFQEGLSHWGVHGSADKYPGLYDLTLAFYADVSNGDRLFAGHLLSAVFGFVSVLAVSLLAREFGGWRCAFLAALFLITIPRFYGHVSINPKDIPFAATYLLGVIGVVRLARRLPDARFADWCLAGVGAGLAMATRLPGLIILCYLLLTCVWCLVGSRLAWLDAPVSLKRVIAGFTAAALIAYFVLALFFPASHLNPLSDSVRVVTALHDFSSSIPLLYRGEVIDAGVAPRTYLPWMLLITTPLAHCAFGLLGLILVSNSSIKAVVNERCVTTKVFVNCLIVLACLFPLVYILIQQPAIHNGVRHVLFIMPLCAVLMAYGLSFSLDQLRTTRWRGVSTVCVVAYFLFAIVALVRLHPYQYLYFNQLIGGPAGALGQYETEYWFTSTGHAVEELREWRTEAGFSETSDGPVRIAATGPVEVTQYYLPENWELVADPAAADYFIGNTQFAGHLLGAGRTIITIERMGLPILYVKEVQSSAPPELHRPNPE